MSHNLMEDGKRMMYVGEKPWHNLGVALDKPATAEEAIQASKLNYEIEKKTVFIENDEGKAIAIGNKVATVVTETQQPLGIVSSKYEIIQNVDAFSFFDSVVETGDAIYHTAGALGKGERIWILAKLPKDILLFKDDIVEEYILLTNSHDGTSALQMFFTPIRVVRQNTLTMSLRSAKNGVSIRHMGNIKGKVNEARRILGLALDFYKDFEQHVEILGNYKMQAHEVESYYNRLLNIDMTEKQSTRSLNIKNSLLTLFETGKGNNNPQIRHSAWTAYNAVTEYADHYRTIKKLETNPTNRLKNIWLGSGADLKSKAFDNIMELVTVNN